MAIQRVWIGNYGPFIYDDTEDLPDEPAGTKAQGIRTTGRVRAAPAENDDEVPTRGQVNTDLDERIVDDLESDDPEKVLSAKQGKVLDEKKVDKDSIVDNLSSTDSEVPLSAKQGRELDEKKLEAPGNIVPDSVRFSEFIRVDDYIIGDFRAKDGSHGWTGSFTNGDGDTVTVQAGIITDVS